MSGFEKEMLSQKVHRYATRQFSLQDTVDMWDKSMLDTIKNWKKKYKRWDSTEY